MSSNQLIVTPSDVTDSKERTARGQKKAKAERKACKKISKRSTNSLKRSHRRYSLAGNA